jgi:hypothetical protein
VPRTKAASIQRSIFESAPQSFNYVYRLQRGFKIAAVDYCGERTLDFGIYAKTTVIYYLKKSPQWAIAGIHNLA